MPLTYLVNCYPYTPKLSTRYYIYTTIGNFVHSVPVRLRDEENGIRAVDSGGFETIL